MDLRSSAGVRAAIFDLDGTLVDNMRFHAAAWTALFARLGTQVAPERFERELAGKKSEEIFELLLGHPLPAARAAALAEEKDASYRTAYAPQLREVPGLTVFLGRLRAAGIRLAVATGAPPANRDLVLDGLSLRHFFDAIVGPEHAVRGKPAPDIFLAASAALGIEPAACIAFEDALNGVRAARAAGMICAAVTTVNGEAALREAGAQHALARFDPLPRDLEAALFPASAPTRGAATTGTSGR
jgi:beta-phosphoglucomutase family hydrolase